MWQRLSKKLMLQFTFVVLCWLKFSPGGYCCWSYVTNNIAMVVKLAELVFEHFYSVISWYFLLLPAFPTLWGHCGRHNSPPNGSTIDFIFRSSNCFHIFFHTVYPSKLRPSFENWWHFPLRVFHIVFSSGSFYSLLHSAMCSQGTWTRWLLAVVLHPFGYIHLIFHVKMCSVLVLDTFYSVYDSF